MRTPLSRLSAEQQRFLKFALVGSLGTALDFGALTALKLAGWPTLAANSLSFTLGLSNNFILNRNWTFRERRRAAWSGQLAQFALVSLTGLALNNLIVVSLEGVFTPLLGGWAYLPAKVLATGAVLFWNYYANRNWTFREVPT